MPTTVTSPGNPAAAAPEVPGQSWEDKLWSVGKSVAIFVVLQFALRQFMGGGSSNTTSTTPPSPFDSGVMSSTPGEFSNYASIPETIFPLWPANVSVDVNLYISDSVVLPALSALPRESLIVAERNFSLDRAHKDGRQVEGSFAVPRRVQDNGTLWAHIFVAQHGAEMDPASPRYDAAKAYRMLRPLTSFLPKKKVRHTRNLLEATQSNDTGRSDAGGVVVEEEPEPVSSPTSASYYHPNFTLSFVPDTGAAALAQLVPAVRQFYTLEATGARDATGKNGWYYPVLYLNTFWQLKTHMTELNATHPIPRLPINVGVSTLANWQFSIMASMDEGMKETARKAAAGQSTPNGGDGSELELIKETLLDTNPWLLGTTAVVSVLHMLFELLAFKSDVGHWRKKKDNVGVSVRTILSNVVMQCIIFLYLLDNNESTSWMILFGQGTGIAIEAWKITKTVNVRLRVPPLGSFAAQLGLPYTVAFEDKHALSETEEKTEEYDRIAFRYMGVIAVPLLAAYAVYSLVYDTHKSWYSFVITTLVGSVYAYGFLMMVPSLYINYRLKSVAHMPARTMMYKFLNTFIDDLFAFTIKMPTLHRLATLRDDVIFFVYIYQAWKYKVDYGRVNEFGQGGDEDDSVKEGAVVGDAARLVKETKEGGPQVVEGKREEVMQALKEAKGQESGGKSSGKDVGGGAKRRKG